MAMAFLDQMACSELFTNLVVNLTNGEIRYCCKTTHIDPFTVDDLTRLNTGVFDRNDQILRARAEMLFANRLPEICQQCHGAGPGSFFRQRNRFNHVLSYDERLDLMLGNATDNYEIVVGNACDLKCIYCNEGFSTSWALEKGVDAVKPELGWSDTIMQLLFAHMDARYGSRDNLDRVIYLRLTGGEPTYTPTSLNILEQVNQRYPHVGKHFRINTNGNTRKVLFDRWLDAMRDSPETSWIWAFSLDDLGRRCEAIRYGLDWDTCMHNMNELFDIENAQVRISPSFSVFNLPNCVEFLRFFVDLYRSKGSAISFGDNSVNNAGIGIKSLPPHYVHYIDEAISFCESIPHEVHWVGRERWMAHLRSVRASIGTACGHRDRDALLWWLAYLAEKRPDVEMMKAFPHLTDVINWYSTNVR